MGAGGAGPEAARRLRDRLADGAGRAGDQFAAARGRSAAVDAAAEAWERDRDSGGGTLAGAVAFRLFTYLLPLFLSLVTLLGVLTQLGGDPASSAGRELGLSTYLVDSVRTAAEETRRGLWALVPLAAFGTYLAGVGAANVVRAAYALAWGLPVRRLQRGRTGAVASLAVVLSTLAVVALTQALRQRSAGLGLGFVLLQVLLLTALWWVTSTLLPRDPSAGRMALLPGALLVGVGVWALHVASVFLLARRVAKASALYGSLGVAAAVLAWLYLLGRLLVGSAMLGSSLHERRRRRTRPADAPVPEGAAPGDGRGQAG